MLGDIKTEEITERRNAGRSRNAKVVYHFLGETGWSTVLVNGTRQNSKWKFSVGCARFISTTFSLKIGLKGDPSQKAQN